MTQITGKATVRVDGEELLSEVGATLNVGGVEREAQLGPRGVQGYKENPVAPSIQVTVQHTGETDIVQLAGITAASVLFETDTGVTYLMREAFVTEPPELDASAGTFALNFSGMGLERV
ncbi:phage tail tube protein [Sediminicurvatus halobius]|uniref:Phage tail protein n=1 Tax=Sediminicurvatus halobius TaxID=2182432 RepID=A0A2U2N161_9GAMM|nr:phage tail tube protein [Spiribacter halobius]PWG62860.1 phage tail protein [Spiribacter halobius]UEX76988.1 phage tail tube protein [Spiribacter halobius]